MSESRRSMLLGVSGWALGSLVLPACQSRRGQVSSARRTAHLSGAGYSGAGALPGPRLSDASALPQAPAPVCGVTEANIEGPYYRPGAPRLADLRAGAQGVPLVLSGRVLSADCRSALAGATVDVWHADAAGHYDNDGSGAMDPRRFHFRGVVIADARGEYRLTTIIPGRYLNGRQYRPAHIHVKLSAPGHTSLTTQLYFPDDPFNAVDPFLRESLVIDLEGDAHDKRGAFDFVLAPEA